MNLSVESDNKQMMWDDEPGTREGLLQAANLEPDVDDKSRTCALAALWSLAVEQKNRVSLRSEDRARAALTKAANCTDSSDVNKRARERALGTVQYLTTDPENKEAIWEDTALRTILIEATRLPNEGKVRIYGLGALWNLSSCSQNQEKMWLEEQGTRAAVIDVAKDGSSPENAELQERAMA